MSRRERTKAALAILLIVGDVVIAVWLWNRPLDPQEYARQWVYAACNQPWRVKAADVRAIGPAAVPFLIQMLRVQDTAWRRLMVRLQRNPPKWIVAAGGWTIGLWLERKSPEWLRSQFMNTATSREIHDRAANLLNQLGPSAKLAVPDLLRCLDVEKSHSVVAAIGAIGPDAREALPELRLLLTNADWFYKVGVASALWSVGRETNSTLNIFTSALSQSNIGGASMMAVMGAAKMDQSSRESIASILIGRLQDTNRPKAHAGAALMLRLLSTQSDAIQRALFEGTKDADIDARSACSVTLWYLWPTNGACASLGTRVYVEWAAARNPDPVNFVLRAHNMGIDPATAVPALKDLLKDEDPNIRSEAAKALNLIVHTTAKSATSGKAGGLR